MAEQFRKFTGSEASVLVSHDPEAQGVIIGAVITEAGILTTKLWFGEKPTPIDEHGDDEFDVGKVEELLTRTTRKEGSTDEDLRNLSITGRQLLWQFCANSTIEYPDIEEVDAAADLVVAMFGLNLHDTTLSLPPGSVVTMEPNELM